MSTSDHAPEPGPDHTPDPGGDGAARGAASHVGPAAAPAAAGTRMRRIRLGDPGELVTAVPYLLGHTGQRDDLVLIAQNGGRVVLGLRVDLAVLPAHTVWATSIRALANTGARTVQLLAYPSAPVTDALLARLHADLTHATATSPPGITVTGALTVTAGRWWAHDLTGNIRPAGPGTPVPDNPALTLALTLGYGVPAASRDAAVSVLNPHPQPVLDQVARLVQQLPVRTRSQRHAAVQAAHAARAERPCGWTLPDAASVIDAVTDIQVRDLALAHVGEESGWWVWSTLLPYAHGLWAAPVATLLAVTAHQRGDGVLANAAIARALAADPDYSLAGLYRQILDAAIPPDQVRSIIGDALTELTPPTT
jgi:hypothetical protein